MARTSNIDMNRLRALRGEGLSYARCADELGCHTSTVQRRLAADEPPDEARVEALAGKIVAACSAPVAPGPADPQGTPQSLPAPVVKSYAECVLVMFNALADVGSVDRARKAFEGAAALYRKARGE